MVNESNHPSWMEREKWREEEAGGVTEKCDLERRRWIEEIEEGVVETGEVEGGDSRGFVGVWRNKLEIKKARGGRGEAKMRNLGDRDRVKIVIKRDKGIVIAK